MSPSEWKWRAPRTQGIWQHGAAWAKPLMAAVPWVTLALVLAMFGLVSTRLVAAPGVVFDLPDTALRQDAEPGLAALVLPSARADGGGTLVFFDDARYSLADENSAAALQTALEARAHDIPAGALLLLADRRVSAGDIMSLMSLARRAGLKHVQIAEKRK